MDIYPFLIQNKETFKVVYAAILVAICIIIVLKTDKLFRLSSHNGIRYFRNAFFFFGIGFASRYFLKYLFTVKGFEPYSYLPTFIFEFFIIMAGFFLLYSLIWRKLEARGLSNKSSLFNTGIIIFYIFALVIAILDYLWATLLFMFISQIIIFLLSSIISFKNSLKVKKPIQKLYFAAMLISLFAWILNTLLFSFFNFNLYVMANVYILNTIFFVLFLYGVFRAMRS